MPAEGTGRLLGAVFCRCAPKHQAAGGLAVGAGRRRFFCRGTVLRSCPCGRNGDAAAGIVCGIPGVFPLLPVHAPLFWGEHSLRRFPYRCLCRKASASFCSGKPGAFIRRRRPGKGPPRRSSFRHTGRASCRNKRLLSGSGPAIQPEKPPSFPGGGFSFGAWPARTCCGVMPSRRLRDVPHPRAVLPPSARAEGEHPHRFSGARRAAGRIFLCLPRQRLR